MRRRYLSLLLLVAGFSSLFIFQNCGKGGNHGNGNTSVAQGSFDNQEDVLNGSVYQGKITPAEQAQDLHKRLSGVSLSPADPKYAEILTHVASGRRDKAAEIIVANNPTFYTVVVRDFANKMSTREGTTLSPLSDFVATVIGMVRDNRPATEFLTADYIYRVRGVQGVSDDELNHIVKSNKHYEDLENANIDYVSKLERAPQRVLAQSGVVVDHPDTAGLLTSRAWLSAHAIAGTNRRIIEYTFKMFQCAPIESWANTSNPDSHVGRDIGRFPIEEYNNKCKGCHTGMDGMRPATAHYDFYLNESDKSGYVKYRYTYATDPDPNDPTKTVPVPADEQLVPYKFRRAVTPFPLGKIVKTDEWINYAPANMFGWNTPTEGQGMADLGTMIALSDGFNRCMVQRVFSSLCKYDLTAADNAFINKMATDFKYDGHNLKNLFVNIALRPECLGVEE